MSNNLIGLPGIANLIGLTHGSVKQLSTHGKLPVPDVIVDGRRLWKESTIVEWDKTRPKRYDNRKANR